MIIYKNQHQRLIILFAICLLYGCGKQSPTIIFPQNHDVVEIPFNYSKDGSIICMLAVEGDTLQFLVDTGSDVTIIPTGKRKPDNQQTIPITDSFGITRKLKTCMVKSLNLGNITIQNLKVMTSSSDSAPEFKREEGILGGDILKYFTVKIDNAQQKLFLHRTKRNIELTGYTIPFEMERNRISVYIKIDGQKKRFLLDTGYNGDFWLAKDEHSKFMFVKESRWLDKIQTAFSNIPDSSTYFLADAFLGNKIYSKVICYYNSNLIKNLIGTIFIRRFKSVTIDYLSSIVYFELPAGNEMMNFEVDTIKSVPTSYLTVFYGRINSLGVQFTDTAPFILEALQKRKEFDALNFGDTLVGIDETVFNEYAFNQLGVKNNKSFRFEENPVEQRDKLHKIFYRSNRANFHFLKGNRIVTVLAIRDTLLSPPPPYGYNFSMQSSDYFRLSSGKNGFYWHLPWSTLTGNEVKITMYKNGKEQIINNNPLCKDQTENDEN